MTLFNKLKNLLGNKTIVLMYHRIAEVEYDPWRLCVTRENFEEQVALLKRYYEVVSVDDVIKQLQEGRIIQKSVCVTFDDGYADNFLEAKPILEHHDCPATFFIANRYIGSGQLFWWDMLIEVLLGTAVLPSELDLDINGDKFTYSLKDTELSPEQISLQKKWEWPAIAPNDRCKLYLLLWEQLLPLTLPQTMHVLDQLVAWASYSQIPANEMIPMTKEQLKTLSSIPLFHLGIHTATHPALPFHDLRNQVNEMQECKNELSRDFSNNVNAIAFPYGRYNDNSLKAMQEAGIFTGFTTAGKSINKHSNILTLGRMQVANWSSEVFAKNLKNWFSGS